MKQVPLDIEDYTGSVSVYDGYQTCTDDRTHRMNEMTEMSARDVLEVQHNKSAERSRKEDAALQLSRPRKVAYLVKC